MRTRGRSRGGRLGTQVEPKMGMRRSAKLSEDTEFYGTFRIYRCDRTPAESNSEARGCVRKSEKLEVDERS